MIWHLDLFSGIGGFALAAEKVWPGIKHTFVEWEPFCQSVLRKHWPSAKIYSDIDDFNRLCKENAHDAGLLADLLNQTEYEDGMEGTAENANQSEIENGARRTKSVKTSDRKNGWHESGKKSSRTTVGNAPAAEKQNRSSSHSITSTTMEQRNVEFTEASPGISQSNEDIRPLTNSFVTTVITPRGSTEYVHTKKENNIRAFVADTKSARQRAKSALSGKGVQPQDGDKGVYILTGGFPCQPFSTAGRRKGTEDDRYLWPEMLECIRIFRPRWVIAENVRGLVTWNDGMVLETVCSDLEREGYEVWPLIIPAASVGAPHRRERIWIVAHASGTRRREITRGSSCNEKENERWTKEYCNVPFGEGSDASNSAMPRLEGSTRTLVQRNRERFANGNRGCWNEDWPSVAARLCGVSYGLPAGMDFALRRVEDEYGTPYQKDRGKSMRNMREALCAPQVRETFGRLYQIPDTEVLLETMRGIPEHSYEEWLDATSDPIQEGFLRELWEQREIRRASRGWRHNEQLAEKHQNALPQVPYEASLAIAEAWHRVRFAQQAYEAEGYKLKGSRNSRLKALGNAIVPQVAEMIMRAIKAADV